jgi:spermidine dehydrogenase
VDVRHEGRGSTAADTSSSVLITYVHHGRLRTVRAKSVVVGVGGWVARRMVSDLPPAHAEAYGQFRYGPILTANVAVRHWRFFDKLGFTVARWFEGLGWHVCVRRNVAMGKGSKPLTPDSPVVLTFYIPFLHPGADPAVQGTLGRAQLLEAPYAEFERRLIGQLTEMFGSAGFDARRDVAGVILNRWGHAYFAPPPGFFFGQSGTPPPHEVIRKPHGRIVFAHSELQGNMNMAHAMLEGRRAAVQAMQALGVSS